MYRFAISPKISLVASAVLLGLMTGVSSDALAQDANSAKKENDVEKITVTGSRIRRVNELSGIPVQALNTNDIEEIGTVDVGEILAEIPGVEQSISPENTTSSTQNSALSVVQLRRMGSNRTLTLIDGKRAISNSGNGERVSLQTIPAGFVKRVEVTTGGASAIYGTDAIAGVANIILRDDWEGVELNVRGGTAEASGENTKNIDFTYGSNFNDDRGNVLFALSYDHESAIFADHTRPDSLANIEFNRPNVSKLKGEATNPNAFGSELGYPGCDQQALNNDGKTGRRFCVNPSGSSNLPGGIFEGDDAWNIGGVWYNDKSLLPQDGRTSKIAFETDVDGYNFRHGRTLSPKVETLALGLKTSYDIDHNTSVFADVNFSRVESMRRSSALSASSGTDIGSERLARIYAQTDPNFAYINRDIGTMSSKHPFIPEAVEQTRSGSVSWRRRFVEVGNRDTENKRDTLRAIVGIEGATENDWQWSTHASYGKFSQRQQYINELNYLRIRQAFRIETDGNGGYQCTDEAARAAGCVPLNIFGEGSISKEAANFIRFNDTLKQDRQQYILAFEMNGELMQLDAGPVSIAFGAEYRKERQQTDGGDDNQLEYTSITPIPDITASFDVKEVYAEADIPLVEDELSLQIAARYADYSTVGGILSYNLGGSWQAHENLRLRAQYSRSQRAPTLTEFFSPARGDSDSVRDPCDGLMPDGSGIKAPTGTSAANAERFKANISRNCLAEAGIKAFFANPDTAGEAFEFDGRISGPNAGNDQLIEETADTYTFGAVFTPFEELSIIVDYYSINVEDAIGSVSSQRVADSCYSADDTTNNRFCAVLQRDNTTGRIQQILNKQENLNEISVEGIDTDITYETESSWVPGNFKFSLVWAHYINTETNFEGLEGPQVISSLGEIGRSKDEFRARLRWTHNNWTASYKVRFRGSGVDNNEISASHQEYFKADALAIHNLYLRYRIKGDTRIDLYGGVSNLFDEFGAVLPTGLDYGNSRNIISRLSNVTGREFYAGVKIRW